MSGGNYIGRGPMPVSNWPVAPRGMLDGFVIATAGGSAQLNVGPGMATDSTAARIMSIGGGGLGKTTAAWAVGHANGGLDTGVIAPNTWYHVHVIQRTDGTVTDVLLSLSATAPVMPAGYTFRRRVGAWKTNGASQWYLILQWGDEFHWLDAVANDYDAGMPVAATNIVLPNVPTGVRVLANWRGFANNGGGASNASGNFRLYTIGQPDTAAADNSGLADLGIVANFGNAIVRAGGNGRTLTDLNAQVRMIGVGAGFNATVRVWSWQDLRGKDA